MAAIDPSMTGVAISANRCLGSLLLAKQEAGRAGQEVFLSSKEVCCGDDCVDSSYLSRAPVDDLLASRVNQALLALLLLTA